MRQDYMATIRISVHAWGEQLDADVNARLTEMVQSLEGMHNDAGTITHGDASGDDEAYSGAQRVQLGEWEFLELTRVEATTKECPSDR